MQIQKKLSCSSSARPEANSSPQPIISHHWSPQRSRWRATRQKDKQPQQQQQPVRQRQTTKDMQSTHTYAEQP